MGNFPNEESKSWKLIEKKNWLSVASKQKEKFLNLFIKGRTYTNFCIELPGLCSKDIGLRVQDTLTIQHLILGAGLYDHLMSLRTFTLIMSRTFI